METQYNVKQHRSDASGYPGAQLTQHLAEDKLIEYAHYQMTSMNIIRSFTQTDGMRPMIEYGDTVRYRTGISTGGISLAANENQVIVYDPIRLTHASACASHRILKGLKIDRIDEDHLKSKDPAVITDAFNDVLNNATNLMTGTVLSEFMASPCPSNLGDISIGGIKANIGSVMNPLVVDGVGILKTIMTMKTKLQDNQKNTRFIINGNNDSDYVVVVPDMLLSSMEMTRYTNNNYDDPMMSLMGNFTVGKTIAGMKVVTYTSSMYDANFIGADGKPVFPIMVIHKGAARYDDIMKYHDRNDDNRSFAILYRWMFLFGGVVMEPSLVSVGYVSVADSVWAPQPAVV